MEKLFVGVDLGGTKLSIGLINQDGKVIDKTTVYDHRGKEEIMIIDQISLLIRQLLSKNNLIESDIRGIGMGFPGHVRYKDGHTLTTSNLKGFKNFPLRQAMQERFRSTTAWFVI